MTDQAEAPAPVLIAEGEFALFQAEGGARVIRYQNRGEDGELGPEKFVAIPAEIVPALEALAANPDALMRISTGPMGAMARRMASRAASQLAGGADGNV